jgi:hypothetical protein
MKIVDIFKKHSIIGVSGNRSSGKTMMVLTILKDIRRKYPAVKMAAMGINPELNPVLERYGIDVIESKMDILDLRITDTIIYVSEIATIFNTRNKNKQQDKLERFIDRIDHQNCKLIIETAREGYYNKFACGRVKAFLVKTTDYESLVNGTWLNERVQAIQSTSDYRVECEKGEYYLVTNTGELTTKHTFPYNEEFDTKKKNIDLFTEQQPSGAAGVEGKKVRVKHGEETPSADTLSPVVVKVAKKRAAARSKSMN